MNHQRLFAIPAVVVNLQLVFVEGQGWSMQVASRPHNGPWPGTAWTHYSGLTVPELLDVVDQELLGRL